MIGIQARCSACSEVRRATEMTLAALECQERCREAGIPVEVVVRVVEERTG